MGLMDGVPEPKRDIRPRMQKVGMETTEDIINLSTVISVGYHSFNSMHIRAEASQFNLLTLACFDS